MTYGRLSEDQVSAAAEVLVALRVGRSTRRGLPGDLTPEAAEDVQRIIDAVSARIETPVRAWKTYCLYKPMTPVLCAPIYDVLPSGAEIPFDLSPTRLIEPEIMFRVDRNLPPRDHPYDIVEVLESVTALVGFEVIGSRFTANDASGADGVGSLFGSLSDHLANGCIVVGDAIPGWRDVAFEDVELTVTEDGRDIVSIVGCHPLDNPFLPVMAGVNRLRRRAGVHAGDVIITSSSTSILPVSAGTEIRAHYAGLGEVRAAFAGGPTSGAAEQTGRP